jgi:hypothetical protein
MDSLSIASFEFAAKPHLIPAAEVLLVAPLIGEIPGAAMPPEVPLGGPLSCAEPPMEPLDGPLMALPELPMAPI